MYCSLVIESLMATDGGYYFRLSIHDICILVLVHVLLCISVICTVYI